MKRFLSILLLVLCSISALGQNSPNKLAGHEFVDLGLPSRTLWATCNVGASSPEEFGDHFAWGETTPKNEYALKNYKYYVSGGSKRKKVILSKYVTSSEHGEVDNKRRLDTSDDVAHTSWGSDWRMPTSAELEELSNECTWTWTTRGGRYGYKVTGKNGSWIFLPAAGIRDGKNLIDPGYKSAYWTSELSSSAKPSHLYICGDYMHEVDLTEYSGLHYGFSVRPVFKKASADSGNSKSSTGSGSKSAGGTGASGNTKPNNTAKSGTGASGSTNSSGAAKTAGTTASSGSTRTAGSTSSLTAAKSTASSNSAGTSQSSSNAKTAGATASSGNTKTAGSTSSSTAAKSTASSNSAGTPKPSGSTNSTVGSKPSQSANKDANDPKYNGHEYVDLGLRVKWATCNVGASSPTEYGDRFAWGETKPSKWADKQITKGYKGREDWYKGYGWDEYKFGRKYSDGTIDLDKYNNGDHKTVLDLSDDAARVNWGGEWRMPTEDDYLELIRSCKIELDYLGRDDQGGNVYVYRVTSKINGNSIVFPVVRLLKFEDWKEYYWSSTIDREGKPENALYIRFSNYGESEVRSDDRCVGLPVRPVIK